MVFPDSSKEVAWDCSLLQPRRKLGQHSIETNKLRVWIMLALCTDKNPTTLLWTRNLFQMHSIEILLTISFISEIHLNNHFIGFVCWLSTTISYLHTKHIIHYCWRKKRLASMNRRAERGWAMKRAGPSKQMWCSRLGPTSTNIVFFWKWRQVRQLWMSWKNCLAKI